VGPYTFIASYRGGGGGGANRYQNHNCGCMWLAMNSIGLNKMKRIIFY